MALIRDEYWWLDCRDTGLHWAQCLPGATVPVAEGHCADVGELPAPPGADLVVSIPGEKVRIHRVSLPQRNRRKFLASLPYILEDRLLHAPENHHLTVFPADAADSDLPVAVIARSYLGPLLVGLQQKDWRLRIICPDYCFIENPDERTWVLDLSALPMLLRFPGMDGGAVISGEPGPHPPGTLLLALEQATVLPERIRVFTRDAGVREMIARWRAGLKERGIDVELVDDDRSRVTRFSRSPVPPQGFNLLTGPYAVRRRYAREVRRLIPLASLSAVLLLVWALHWFVSARQLKQEYTGLQDAMEQTYRGLFPGARNLVDPRFQMEQKLLALQQTVPSDSGTNRGFLHRLEQFATASEGLDARLEQMHYDDKGMIVELTTPDYQVLEDLQSRLRGLIGVTVEGSELKEKRVYSRIRLGAEA